MDTERRCRSCEELLSGRVDQLYCNEHCRSAFHYKKKKSKVTLFRRIDNQLKLNRRLLQHFNPGGKATIRTEELLKAGFDPKYFTHYWRNPQKQVYFFCYDQGYLKLNENGKEKYVLVHWQDYMV